MAGCKVVQQPLPANAVNAVDAGLNANLQAAHAFIAQYQLDVLSSVHAPAPGEIAVMNKVTHALNTADALYQAYHKTLLTNPMAGEPAELAAAVTAVTTNLNDLKALLNGVK